MHDIQSVINLKFLYLKNCLAASGRACILPGKLLPHMRGIHNGRPRQHCQQHDHGLHSPKGYFTPQRN